METNFVTDIFLPLSLAIIMLGMGLSLTPADFKRIIVYPKAVAIGIINQILVLPLIGFLLILVFKMENVHLAVGVMVLAACPGGPTSNLIAHISKGDTALSISLTALSSLITVITIPLIVNFSLAFFMQQGEYIPLPILGTILSLVAMTLIPVFIGMLIRAKASGFAARMDKPVKILSGVLLVIMVLGAILSNKEILSTSFRDVGPLTLALNILMLVIGYASARLFRLDTAQSVSISIETGVQNGTLGIMIASTLLKNNVMAITPGIYSLVMFITSGFLMGYVHLKARMALRNLPDEA